MSVDDVNDERSAIVDGLSAMVVKGSQLKVQARCDGAWGFSCRLADLACHVARLTVA